MRLLFALFTVALCLHLTSAVNPVFKRMRFAGVGEPCADINAGSFDTEELEIAAFVGCYVTPKKKITSSSGAEYEFGGAGQLTQGGFKRLFTGKVTKKPNGQVAGFPNVGTEVIIAASKIKVADAKAQLTAEHQNYKDNDAVAKCPNVMKIYDGWADANGKVYWMVFEKIDGLDGKGSAAKYFAADGKLTLKQWAKITKQMYSAWSCIIKAGKYIHDSDLKNMMLDTGYNYKLIDLDIKTLDGDWNEEKTRNFILKTSLQMGGAWSKDGGKECYSNWAPAYGGTVRYFKECHGVISKATEAQQGKISTMVQTAATSKDSAGGGLTGAKETDVLTDGTLSSDAVAGDKWKKP